MNKKRAKTAILLAAYGASNFQGKEGLRNFESLCRAGFPQIPVRWAFTSLPLIRRLAQQRRKSDSLHKALMKLAFEKFELVAIQPLQTIPGSEYEDVLARAAAAEAEAGIKCLVGKPLLSGAAGDIDRAARALLGHFPPGRQAGEDIVLMGHGAKHPAVAMYEKLDMALGKMDCHAHVGTMEGRHGLAEILPRLTSGRVWLMPLLSLTGKHAIEDMAGCSADSWKSRIEASGHECVPVLRGMAEYAGIVEIWLEHLRCAAGEMLTGAPQS